MIYDEKKIEAVKILIPEIIELNQKLGTEREILVTVDGGSFPGMAVKFWDWAKSHNPQESFDISLEGKDRAGDRHSMEALVKVLNEWREKYAENI